MRWCVLLVVLLFAVPGWAQVTGSTSAGPAAADRAWNPSLDQVTGWVLAGIEAAAAEMYLPDIDGVDSWTWSGDTAAGGEQRLEWAILLTPQFVATVTGYEAAWQEGFWQRIQAGDTAAVSIELAAAVLKAWKPGTVQVVLGLTGREKPETAAWLKGMWHDVRGGSGSSATSFARGGMREGAPTAEWAAAYYVSKVDPALVENTMARIVTITPQPALWDETREASVPEDEFTKAIGAPDAEATVLRVYTGTADEWAYVDWELG